MCVQLLDETKKETDAHFPKLGSAPPAGKYMINVTNTGSMDADDVVRFGLLFFSSFQA